MKHLTTFIIALLLLTSCGSTGEGAYNGAMFGSIIGSAIGGLAGGRHGEHLGTLVGMATGAATGAAIGAASEVRRTERYDDVITMREDDTPMTRGAANHASKSVKIQNVRFINDRKTTTINKGELVKIAFEIRNTSNAPIADIVPLVKETTGNKRLVISPSTMIERLPPHRTIRYTAYVSAQKNLRRGTAHFVVQAASGPEIVSNEVEFDIQLAPETD